jgi:predicted secreted protein
MAESAAGIGYGSLLEVSTDNGATWAEVAEVTNITPPSDTVDSIDVTHMQSPNRTREFIPGLADPGECSIEMNFIPGAATDVQLRTLKANGTKAKWRITWPNAVIWVFSGFVTGVEATGPVDDKMAVTATIKVTGAVVPSPAAVPVNSVKPAVSGLAKVAVVLTAWPGIWSGAPTFAYQWKKAGANIGGAINPTYTPVVGDIGAAITVLITPTNAAGAGAPVESAATAAVIA